VAPLSALTALATPALALFDWVPRSATAVGVLAGPLVVLGYLAGSVPFAYLLSRRRLRRQLADPAPDRHYASPGRGPRSERREADATAALPVAATLAATTLAWHLTLAATPGANTFSGVGVFSNQAIGAWVSVALWTGAAAVAGHVAPVWTGFRGGSGIPPALALGVVYVPLLTLVAAGAFLVAYGVTRRPLPSLLRALPVVVTVAYLTWLADLQAGWGVTNGPEVTLWTTAVSATLFARNLAPARAGSGSGT
jgi:glycerol-3-phosphate acyltransferase PlsY